MISVIIPIYILDDELASLTRKTLDGLKKYKDLEIIIVDNASPLDLSQEWVNKCDIYIKNSINWGNGEGWNQGYKLSHGEYIWFCDNDLNFVDPTTAQELVETLLDPKVAVAFPFAKNSDQTGYFEQLAGFCWMTKRAIMQEIGLISLDYGIANFEDTDFYMRCIEAGYKLCVNENTRVEHVSRATCDKVPAVRERYEINKAIYESKFGGKYPHLSS